MSQDSLSITDFGLDLPLGGLGNPAPGDQADQLFIGPSGTPYKIESDSPVFVKDLQHGHLFLGMYEFGLGKGNNMAASFSPANFDDEATASRPRRASSTSSGSKSISSFITKTSKVKYEEAVTTHFVGSLLLGIESSAPLKTDFFGQRHGLDGASKPLSAFGKQKWKNYQLSGLCIPRTHGGIRMDMDADRLAQLEQIFSQLELCRPSEQHQRHQNEEKSLFRQLLQSSSSEAARIIDRSFDLGPSGADSPPSASVEENTWRDVQASVNRVTSIV